VESLLLHKSRVGFCESIQEAAMWGVEVKTYQVIIWKLNTGTTCSLVGFDRGTSTGSGRKRASSNAGRFGVNIM
jgi:hypothetical protein